MLHLLFGVMISNKYGLPEFLVEAVKNDSYERGDSWRTVTELIGPPQIALLKRRHADEIVVDVTDRIYTMCGQIVHGIVERASAKMKDSGWRFEERIYAEVMGKRISGSYDFFHEETGHLIDIKYSTAWSGMQGKPKDEWILQMNSLRELLSKQKREVKKMEILLIIRDWNKKEAARNPGYPQSHVLTLPVPMWPQNKCFFYLSSRVEMHILCEEKMINCTDSERWLRNGVYGRCRFYCDVSKFCPQVSGVSGGNASGGSAVGTKDV